MARLPDLIHGGYLSPKIFLNVDCHAIVCINADTKSQMKLRFSHENRFLWCRGTFLASLSFGRTSLV